MIAAANNAARKAKRVHKHGKSARNSGSWQQNQQSIKRSTLPAIAELEVSALTVDLNDDFVPIEPAVDDPNLDEFTRECLIRLNEKTKNPKSAYSIDGIMPDSMYQHIVEELANPGHLERCKLNETNPMMAQSIQHLMHRNCRFILFDIEQSSSQSIKINQSIIEQPIVEQSIEFIQQSTVCMHCSFMLIEFAIMERRMFGITYRCDLPLFLAISLVCSTPNSVLNALRKREPRNSSARALAAKSKST